VDERDDRELALARAAKDQAKEALSGVADVAGIGLTRIGGRFGVRVNLRRVPDPERRLPEEIAGVPVSYRVVGTIRKQSGPFV